MFLAVGLVQIYEVWSRVPALDFVCFVFWSSKLTPIIIAKSQTRIPGTTNKKISLHIRTKRKEISYSAILHHCSSASSSVVEFTPNHLEGKSQKLAPGMGLMKLLAL